uniref:Uncharacterized protein n=1 Tax=Cacopsylla melanoneura TaxID=428564 RepID=A0A8D9BK17_9HEMI
MTPSIQILMRKQTWNVAFTSTNQNLLRNICLKTNYWMGFQTGWTDCLRALHHASTLRHGRSSKWHNVLSSQHHGLFALSLSLTLPLSPSLHYLNLHGNITTIFCLRVSSRYHEYHVTFMFPINWILFCVV